MSDQITPARGLRSREWLHDYRQPIATFASFLLLSAALGVVCWLYQALCFVVAL